VKIANYIKANKQATT